MLIREKYRIRSLKLLFNWLHSKIHSKIHSTF